MSTHIRWACGCIVVLLSGWGTRGAAQTITNLGTLGNQPTSSSAWAISGDGNVVIGWSDLSPFATHTFRWTAAGGMQDIGTLPGGDYTWCYALDQDGSVISGSATVVVDNVLRTRAFRWDAVNGIQNIGILAGVEGAAEGRAVNSDGGIIAGLSAGPGFRTFRWTSGGMVQIGPTSPASFAMGISGDGATIVGFRAEPEVAMRWEANLVMQPLPTPAGFTGARAWAISDDSATIVGSATTPGGANIAVLWDNDTPLALGTLAEQTHSIAKSVSADGTVALGESTVHEYVNLGIDGAWVYTQTRGLTRLSAYLQQEGVNLTGWSALERCRGISDNGRTIVGTGIYQGAERAFIVQNLPPLCGPFFTEQPAATVACVGGAATLAVTAFGPTFHPPLFQWQKRGNDGEWNNLSNITSPWGSAFSGTTTPVLQITNCSTVDVPGMYRCVVTAGCGSRNSVAATITLINQTASMDVQPQDTTTCPGDTAVFLGGPLTPGGAPYTFQWERETAPNSNVFVPLANGSTLTWDGNLPGFGGIVSGATTGQLTIAPDTANGRILGLAHTRNYRLVVQNACAATVSDAAGLKAFVSCVNGDLNCDAAVSVGDIGAFVLALTNPAAYEAQFPACNPLNADLNSDGFVTVGDIGLFVALLIGG